MKLSHFAILTLVAPISLAAQQPPPGPPANPITTVFRTRISGLHRNIAQAFDSIPQSKFGYKPTPAQLSIGYIAQHIASDDYFFCNNFGAMKGMRPAEDTTTADSVKATWPKDKLVAHLRDSFAFCDQAIAQLDDAKLGEKANESFRCATSLAFGHVALTESAVVVSSAGRVPFIAPKLLQKK